MRSKKLKTAIIAGVLISGLAMTAGSAMAEEEKPSADLTVGAYSQYIWRGYALSDDSIVIQPSLSVGYKGFGVNLWGNLDTDLHTSDTNSFNETDLTISYDGSYGMVSYGVGYIYYALEGADSQEVYGTIGLDTILAPTLTIYRDYDQFDSLYINLGISHSFAITEEIGLDLGASAGYYDYSDRDYNELHDGLVSAAVAIPVGEYVTVSPELYYSFALSSEAENELNFKGDDSFFYGGVSVSFSF